MAQINFPVATADGQTFEAPNGVIYTYVGTPPNGYWSGTFQDQSLQTLDGRYLKLDASNDPVTGNLALAQDLAVTGTSDFTGLTTHENGISVTSGEVSAPYANLNFKGGRTGKVLGIYEGLVTDTEADPKILLNNDGSATFASNLQTDGELVAPYANLNYTGGRTGKVIGIYEGLSGDNPTQPKISLNNDGSASFAGNVGIGASSPQAALEIATPVTTGVPSLYLNRSANQSNTSDVAFVANAVIRSETSIKSVVNADGFFNWSIGGTDSKAGIAGSSEVMRINPNGNVGIGTDNPDVKLDVAGTIKTVTIDYNANQDQSYLIAGTTSHTGASTNWGSYGIQHRFKSNDRGTARVTIDTVNGEAFCVDNNGKVGIGTDNPAASLDVNGNARINTPADFWSSNASYYAINGDGNIASQGSFATYITSNGYRNTSGEWTSLKTNNFIGAAQIRLDPTGFLTFNTEVNKPNGSTSTVTERMRIDSSGNVGIGTDSPGERLDVRQGGSRAFFRDNGSAAEWVVNSENNGACAVYFGDAADTVRGGLYYNCNLDILALHGYNNSERMRIVSGGSIQIHNASSTTPGFNNTTVGASFEKTGDGTALFVSKGGNAPGYFNRNSNGNLLRFFRSGAQVGRIDVTASNATFVGTSDYRLKENVTSLSDGIDRLKLLTPCRFNFIAEPGNTIDGFIAHEVEAAVPEAVFGEKDAMEEQEVEVTPAVLDEDGNVLTEAVTERKSVISPQGIDQGKLVPLLTAALQETIAKVEALEQRLAELEG